MCKKFIIVLILLLVSQVSFGFDSEREGFVIGGGVGYAPTISTEISGFNQSKEKSSGVSLSIFTGYGYNENTQFLFMIEGAKANSVSIESLDESIWQGFSGIGVRFYFDDIGSSFFVTSGIGLQFYMNSSNAEFAHDSGLGFLVGGGYEFAEHFHLQTSFINGRTKDSFNWDHSQINFTLTAILY